MSVPTSTSQLFAQNPESVSFTEECQSFKKPIIPNAATNSRIPMMHNNFKTQLCKRFRNGNCTYGYKCRFAHGVSEMRRPLLHCQGTLDGTGGHQFPPQGRIFGNRDEINVQEASAAITIDCTGAAMSHMAMGGLNRVQGRTLARDRNLDADRLLKPSRAILKTKLCNNWERTRKCGYGRDCCFVHGQAEMVKFRGQTALGFGILHTATPCDSGKKASIGRTGLEVHDLDCTRRELERMSRIYADWIWELPLLYN